jgi:acetyl-CoA carboxylase carboxyltransferase component
MDEQRPEAVAAAHVAGNLTARERIGLLLDPESFVEYGVLAGETSSPTDNQAADGLVAGAGLVSGRPVVAASYDRSVRRGTQTDRNQRKLSRLVYLANSHRWPFVCFVDGDGTRPGDPLPAPPIVVAPRGRWEVYEGLAELSGWAPTIAVVCGRALDGNAGMAMLADCVIATRNATLGARDMSAGSVVERPVAEYASRGHIDLLVDDDAGAIAAVRQYLAYYLVEASSGTPSPAYDTIDSIIPENRRRAYDMRKIISAFADADSVLELGAAWGRSMITVLARLGGRSIGIFANQPSSLRAGAIDAEAADKAARFIELCDAYEFPLVAFIDNPGYMVGPEAEREGIARHHARPLSALHHRTVPLYSVQLRKAYGLGPYAMSGFGSSRVMPDLRLAWPSVESGGMSLEGAAYLVKRREILAAETPEEARAIRDAYAESMRDAASGLRAGRAFAFDDIIHPLETRARILSMLERVPRSFGASKKHPIDPR